MTITVEGPSERLFESPIWGNYDNNAAAEQDQDEEGEDNSEERQLLLISVSAGKNMTRDNFLELRNSGFSFNEDN